MRCRHVCAGDGSAAVSRKLCLIPRGPCLFGRSKLAMNSVASAHSGRDTRANGRETSGIMSLAPPRDLGEDDLRATDEGARAGKAVDMCRVTCPPEPENASECAPTVRP